MSLRVHFKIEFNAGYSNREKIVVIMYILFIGQFITLLFLILITAFTDNIRFEDII